MDATKFFNLLSIMVFVDTTRINKLLSNPSSQPYLNESSSWEQIVRDEIKSIKINEKYVEKIDSLIPGKLIKKISNGHELMKNEQICKSFKSDPSNTNKIIERKIKYFKSIDLESMPSSTIVSLSISSTISSTITMPNFKLALDQLELNDDKIKNILGVGYDIFIQEVKQKYYPYSLMSLFKTKANNQPTLEQQINFLMEKDTNVQFKLLFELEFAKKIQTNHLLARTYLQNLILDLQPQTFHSSIFARNELWKDKASDLSKVEEEVIGEFLEATYPFNQSIKYGIFHLGLDDYWVLSQLDPELVKSIFQERFLLDDITFCAYKYDCWDFLDGLNYRVASNIKTKIHTDMYYQMENRYGDIATLEDLVDVIIFCQAPPKFLELNNNSGLYSGARKLLIDFLKSIEWDMNKLSYLNWNLEVSYKLTQSLV